MTSRNASRRAREADPSPPSAKKVPVVPLALGGLALVVLIGLIIAFTGGGSDDSSDVDTGASSPAATAGGGPESSETVEDSGDPSDADFGTVSINGTLPQFASTDDDPAIGQAAPTIEGQGLDGSTSTLSPDGKPTIVVFLAHWCPHCQRELPLLVQQTEAGTFDGIRMVAVLTGTNPDAPNFPPGAWVQREGWQGDVILDDQQYSAATAFGLSGYPYLVALDADGNVVERTSGELPVEDLEHMAAAAKG
jgi:thiol-disulfide isomerase/thioredoxin